MCSALQDKRTQYARVHVDLGFASIYDGSRFKFNICKTKHTNPTLHDIKIQIANQTTFSIQAEETMPKESVRIAKATNRPHVGLITSGAI